MDSSKGTSNKTVGIGSDHVVSFLLSDTLFHSDTEYTKNNKNTKVD